MHIIHSPTTLRFVEVGLPVGSVVNWWVELFVCVSELFRNLTIYKAISAKPNKASYSGTAVPNRLSVRKAVSLSTPVFHTPSNLIIALR